METNKLKLMPRDRFEPTIARHIIAPLFSIFISIIIFSFFLKYFPLLTLSAVGLFYVTVIAISSSQSLGYKKLRIYKMPNSNLLVIVDFLFSPKTVENIFKPLIADWQYEYLEALKEGRTKKARWISFRYRFIFACTFIKAMGLGKVFSVFKQLSK